MAAYSRGGQGLVYIGRSVNPEPMNQTDFKKRRRCNLGDVEEPMLKRRLTCGTKGPTGLQAGHLSSLRGLPQGNVFWWPLEPSEVVFAADKRNFI
jgi:hypothetical protein